MTRATVDAQTGNTLRAQERDSRRRLGGAMRAGHARMLSVRPASRQSGKADSFGLSCDQYARECDAKFGPTCGLICGPNAEYAEKTV